MQYLGIDWGTRRASWCAIDEHGALREGAISADQDGLARLAFTLGGDAEVRGCIEMMSGAVWVRDQLAPGRLGRSRSPTRARSSRSRRWRARPTASTRACSPISSAATWCPRCGCPALEERANRERLRRRVAPDPAAHVGDQPQLRAAHPVGAAAQPHRAAASPTRSTSSPSTASRRCGFSRSPRCWRSSTTSTASSRRSSASCVPSRAPTSASSC